MRLLIINNIKSGYGDGSVFDFMRCFAQPDDEIVIRTVVHETCLEKLLSDYRNFDMVVAAGDDDIVTKVSYILADRNIPILPYPSGTWNLIAQNLFLPNETHTLAKLAREKKTLQFDIGELIVGDQKFGFGCNAGIGFSTKISKEAMSTKKLFGPLAYIGAAISNNKPQTSKFVIELKDKTIKTEGIGILILNFAKIGLDLSVTHHNRPRDGKFDIVILKEKTATKYIPALTAAALDRAIEFPDRTDAISIYHSSYAKITAEPKMEIQIDGKSIELDTPFEVKVLKHAVNYVVDQECLDNYLNN